MGTLADIPSIDVVGRRSNETSLLSLMEVLCGCPVAGDSDENPFLKKPEDLTENAWHLVRSDQTGDSEAALWKPKGEARRITLDLPVICWEITREFHETNDHRTGWMMLEYKIITVAPCPKYTTEILTDHWGAETPWETRPDLKYAVKFIPTWKKDDYIGVGVQEDKDRGKIKDFFFQESFSICRIWQDQTSHVQVGSSMPSDDNQKRQSADDNPVENSPYLDVFTDGDYLELIDLVEPLYP